MSRIHYWQYLTSKNGDPLQDEDVRVYLAGTDIEANIYLDNVFGSITKSSTESLSTNSLGFFEFWIGDEWETEGGYSVDQQFKVVWNNTVDGIEEEIDNIYIFSPVRPIDISDDVKGVPSNKDIDKVISNRQGYKWNLHVDSIVPSASPHDLEAVVFFDTDTIKNKVISNKLGYQMYEMADTASTISHDVSAATFYSETIATSGWSISGGKYYKDITHNFNNYYPIVRISNFNNDKQILADILQSISPDITRIWLLNNIKVNVIFLG